MRGRCASLSPTAATSGSVKTTWGTAAWSAVALQAPQGDGVEVALGAGDDGVAADAALVLALMGEQGAVVDVAGGVQPTTRHLAHRHGVVDVEPGPGREADGAEAEISGARPAAGGHQQLVRLHRASRRPSGHGDRAAGAAHRRR